MEMNTFGFEPSFFSHISSERYTCSSEHCVSCMQKILICCVSFSFCSKNFLTSLVISFLTCELCVVFSFLLFGDYSKYFSVINFLFNFILIREQTLYYFNPFQFTWSVWIVVLCAIDEQSVQ